MMRGQTLQNSDKNEKEQVHTCVLQLFDDYFFQVDLSIPLLYE